MPDDAVTYRRIPLEIINEGKLDLIDELFAEDLVEHATPPGFPPGREGVKAFIPQLRAAFPDFRYEVLQQYQDGDIHIGYVQATGTMEGEFMAMPPSGKTASWTEVHIGRMANGKVVEHWAVIDALAMVQQAGFVLTPAPEPES